jgi:hypothetical protein
MLPQKCEWLTMATDMPPDIIFFKRAQPEQYSARLSWCLALHVKYPCHQGPSFHNTSAAIFARAACATASTASADTGPPAPAPAAVLLSFLLLVLPLF